MWRGDITQGVMHAGGQRIDTGTLVITFILNWQVRRNGQFARGTPAATIALRLPGGRWWWYLEAGQKDTSALCLNQDSIWRNVISTQWWMELLQGNQNIEQAIDITQDLAFR